MHKAIITHKVPKITLSFHVTIFLSLLNIILKIYAINSIAIEIVIASEDNEVNPSTAIGIAITAKNIFLPNGINFIAKYKIIIVVIILNNLAI